MFKTCLLLALFFFCCSKINANSSSQEKLELVGESKLSFLFWDIYDIKLFAKAGKYIDKQLPIRLELKYQREISSEELVDETNKQWERFELDIERKKDWLNQLKDIWPNVKESDIISFHIDSQNHTWFYFNKNFIGKIEDQEFSRHFSLIWLDINGAYPKITKQLLGDKH
ncbi:MAG: hypothetical protein ACI9IA_002477 [Enterobacterales bacterium]|jgi:hypothetical protein